MRGGESGGAGEVDDGVSDGDTQQYDDDDVADAAHGAAAANVIVWK